MVAASLAAAAGALLISHGQEVKVQSSGSPYGVHYDPAADTLRFELRPGDRWPADAAYNKVKERAEVATPLVPVGQVMRADLKLTVLPGDPNTADWLLLAQVQRRDAAGSWVSSPMISLELRGEHFRWVRRSGDPKAPVYHALWTDPQPLKRGQPYTIAVEVKCGARDGYAVIWMDGVERARVQGENPCFADTASTYFKTGIYRSPGQQTLATAVQGLVVRSEDPGEPPAPAEQDPPPRGHRDFWRWRPRR